MPTVGKAFVVTGGGGGGSRKHAAQQHAPGKHPQPMLAEPPRSAHHNVGSPDEGVSHRPARVGGRAGRAAHERQGVGFQGSPGAAKVPRLQQPPWPSVPRQRSPHAHARCGAGLNARRKASPPPTIRTTTTGRR